MLTTPLWYTRVDFKSVKEGGGAGSQTGILLKSVQLFETLLRNASLKWSTCKFLQKYHIYKYI